MVPPARSARGAAFVLRRRARRRPKAPIRWNQHFSWLIRDMRHTGAQIFVITSVDRDDLRQRRGAFAACIRADALIRIRASRIEILAPDFRGKGTWSGRSAASADVFSTTGTPRAAGAPGLELDRWTCSQSASKAQHPDVPTKVGIVTEFGGKA